GNWMVVDTETSSAAAAFCLSPILSLCCGDRLPNPRLVLSGPFWKKYRSSHRLLGRKVPPARHARDANGDDREAVEFHRAVLGVALAKQGLRPVVFGAVGEDLRRTAQHDPAEPAPVFVPVIGHKSGAWVFDDVFKAPQGLRVALRL